MDSLFAAMLEAPDDDEPRLVWADREGGERGELVVLQCLLARQAGSRVDRVSMAARLRELLPRFQAERETFARGFVDAVTLDIAEVGPELFVRWPLLRELSFSDLSMYIRPAAYGAITLQEAWADVSANLTAAFARLPLGRIRKLGAMAEIHEIGDHAYPDVDHPFGDPLVALITAAPALAGLAELTVWAGELTEAAIPHLARLSLTSFSAGVRMSGARCARLLRALPALGGLGLINGAPPIAGDELAALLPAAHQLEHLGLWANSIDDRDLELLATTPFTRLTTLDLGLGTYTDRGLTALAASPNLASLVELDLYDRRPLLPSLAPFCPPPFALQRLRLRAVDDALVATLVAAPALEKLHLETVSPQQLAQLRAVIPWVNDGRW